MMSVRPAKFHKMAPIFFCLCFPIRKIATNGAETPARMSRFWPSNVKAKGVDRSWLTTKELIQ